MSPDAGAAPGGVHGRADVAFAQSAGATRLVRLDQRAPLRVLFPRAVESGAGVASCVLVTTTGGLVGGDRLDARIEAGPGAEVLATTQAAEKVYRSTGADCRVEVALAAGEGSRLEWLPQETILFEGARLRRTTRLDAAPGAQILAGEILAFGRWARGERLTRGLVRDAWEVRRGGRLVWADALAADGDLAAVLASPACLAGAAAVATLVAVLVEPEAALTFVRDLTGPAVAGEMAPASTCVGGLLVLRWIAGDALALRAAFGRVWAALRLRLLGRPARLPRVWCV